MREWRHGDRGIELTTQGIELDLFVYLDAERAELLLDPIAVSPADAGLSRSRLCRGLSRCKMPQRAARGRRGKLGERRDAPTRPNSLEG
jgi:hypothetical protein